MLHSQWQWPFPPLKQWVRGSALGLSILLLSDVAMAAVPLLSNPQRAQEPIQTAQLLRSQPPPGCSAQGCRLNIDQTILQTNATLSTRYQGTERQTIRNGEVRQIALNLTQPIRNLAGQIVIPANTVIEGEVVPAEGGGRFAANRIIINGIARPLTAESLVLNDVKDPNRTSTGAIARDAALGAAGGIALGQVLGQRRITTVQVLGGAAAGVAVGQVTAPRTVVIEPGQEIPLRLTTDFRL